MYIHICIMHIPGLVGGSINCFSKPRLAAPLPAAPKLTPQLTLEDEFESQSSDEESLDLLAICKGGYREEERRQRVRDQRFASLLKVRLLCCV